MAQAEAEAEATAVKNAPFQWFGGKYEMSSWIIGHFPDHHTYVEPFGGAASVLLRKEPSKVEVYNDLDAALVAFFEVCRDEPTELARLLDLTPYSRSVFEQACEAMVRPDHVGKDETPARIKQAWATAVVGRMSMSGRIGGSWSRSLGHRRAGLSSSVARWLLLPETVMQVASRLKEVQIEGRDACKVIVDYDKPDTLFYLDPPYHPETCATGVYRVGFDIDAHDDLIAVLLDVKGKVVLSGYEHESYDGLLMAGWRLVKREVPCRSDSRRAGKRVECLWIS